MRVLAMARMHGQKKNFVDEDIGVSSLLETPCPCQAVGHLSICWTGIICAACGNLWLLLTENYQHRSYAVWPYGRSKGNA